MAVGLGYVADLVPTAFTNVSSTIFQLLAGATSAFWPHRLELQSNQTGSTQAVLQLQLYLGTASGSGGSTVSITPRPTLQKNTVSSATTVVAGYTTPGAVGTILHTWQWNAASPFDIVFGKDIMLFEVLPTKYLSLIFLTAPGTPTISGTVTFEEA